ncbi:MULTISPECIES: molybdopterin-binding protein [unclassified Achromobacter]|uniref:competence/damage-inducible protein A n=1 Tax=unclassified Achromobacter TaxID=2626865 RepID=UPI000B51AEA4|nr:MULTISPECIES: molybdopterin-binding protein [unclassified Achromobacter]OWT71363.1 competence/damage-inducible protein A [Achromobacter sp. HZ34]OWT73328.1 competence/damage-inducible protein A [Achromobacter sp. HZ28]
MTTANARRIGLIIVGDEILSGRRQDKHFSKVVELLGARGLKLAWAQILSDERDDLVAAYRHSFATGDIVLSCGGIGGTPDDHTRQAAAAALDLPLELHPDAAEQIALRCADMAAEGRGSADMSTPENQQRLQMGVFPVGSEIVPNPYNRIPGFFIRDHTFVPGFPVMAWPMLEWTLDQRYRDLHHQVSHAEHSFLVYGLPESRITPAMEAVQARWPQVRAFSLPSVGEGGKRPHIELGVKGEPAAAAEALAFLRTEAQRLGGQMTAPD